MATVKKAKPTPNKIEVNAIEILKLHIGENDIMVRGSTPLVYNAMSAKVKHEILFPSGAKTRAERASTLRHDPRAEWYDSTYRFRENTQPTRLYFPAGGFKAACMTAALNQPGATKTEIAKLMSVGPINVPIWGIPQLHMSVVRNSGFGHAPDMRTRAILADWCAVLHTRFVMPYIGANAVGLLLQAAGLFVGVGDGRPEKGKLEFGRFEIVGPDDPVFKRLIATAGREAQDEALRNATPYDVEAEEMLEWFDGEIKRRDRGSLLKGDREVLEDGADNGRV